MGSPTGPFSPDELCGTPLSPILEQDVSTQTTPPGSHDTDSTVFVGQFDSRPYRRKSYSKTVIHDFTSQPSAVGEPQLGSAPGKQPPDIWSKFAGNDVDDGSGTLAKYMPCDVAERDLTP